MEEGAGQAEVARVVAAQAEEAPEEAARGVAEEAVAAAVEA